MKAAQKLIVCVENIKLTVRFEDIDKQLIPLVAKLEEKGDEFGPVVGLVDQLCVTVAYADKARGPVKPTLFGYDADEFMAKQMKK